jgi:large conductance mechanosensitive channel
MSGFKAFLLRGNLVELAVAFIMGGAFATVVTAFTALILGIVAKIFGGNPDFTNWKPGDLPFGAFLTALIAFVILAAVVYFFVVMPYQKAKARFFPDEVEDEGVSEEVAVLLEIRDALVARGGSAPGSAPPAGV